MEEGKAEATRREETSNCEPIVTESGKASQDLDSNETSDQSNGDCKDLRPSNTPESQIQKDRFQSIVVDSSPSREDLDADSQVGKVDEEENIADYDYSVRSLPAYASQQASRAPSCAVSRQNLERSLRDGSQLFYDRCARRNVHIKQPNDHFQYRGNTRYPIRRSRSLGGEYYLDRGLRRPSVHRRRLPDSFRESLSESGSSEASTEPGRIRDNWLAMVCLAFLSFTSLASMSIIAPFFPNEASKKGMRETVSGLVFAIYGLVVMIMSPIIGKLMAHLGLKFVLITGVLLSGVANILFGLLDQTDSGTFTFLCFLVRSIEALGAAASSTACFTYVMQTFPNDVGTAFGILETCVGLGMSLGPALGGGLYALGGYGLPFFVLGVVVLLNVPFCWLIIKSPEDFAESKDSIADLPAGKSGYWSLISIPSIFVLCLIIVVVSQSVGFLDPTVEPHFRQYNIGAQYVGLVFLLMSASYGISAPLVGYVAGKTEKKFTIMLSGLILTFVGLILVGPADFTGIQATATISTLAMVIIGAANALAFIPTFETIILIAVQRGFPDDVTTYGLVSGLWSSMNALGEVLGPALGGFLFEHLGFATASTIIAFVCLTAAILALCVCCCSTERLLLSKSTPSLVSDASNGRLLPDPCLKDTCSARPTTDSTSFNGYQNYDGKTKSNFNKFVDLEASLTGRQRSTGSLTGSTERTKLLDSKNQNYGSRLQNA